MDYNTQREKLIMPEYGRHIQKMVEQIKQVKDKEKRNEQIRAVVQVMSTLNPHLKDYPDIKHKLWDHVFAIADYDIDIDSPYPMPAKEDISSKPEMIEVNKTPIKATCYGRNIESMIDLIASREDGEEKNELIKMLALYMRQQYLIWNKDNVSDKTIFNDMEMLSGGKLKVPEGIELGSISGDFSRPGMQSRPQNRRKNKNRQRK
ncbi:MAG: DUF4290 domain-containing protein [Bacteroidales bacterium]|nr:DUF4290 domain-containing protein [Bacteroidales bacterium]